MADMQREREADVCKWAEQAEKKWILVVKEFQRAFHTLVFKPSNVLLSFCALILWDISLRLS